MSLLLLLLGTLEWTETTAEDFLSNLGHDPMTYISQRANLEAEPGCVEFFACFDVDNDGTYDLGAVSRQGGSAPNSDLYLYYGDENLPEIYSADNRWEYDISRGGGGIDLADLNLDGYAELIHSGWQNGEVRIYWSNQSLLPPHPDPNDYTALKHPAGTGSPETVYICDLDKDTYLDIIASSGAGTPVLIVWWGFEDGPHWINYSDDNRTVYYGVGSEHNLEVADIDKDGWADIVCARQGAAYNFIVYWGAEGNPRAYKKVDTLYYPTSGHHGISMADLDNDEWLDVIFTGRNQIKDSYIYFGSADGFVDPPLVLYSGDCYGGSAVWDWNSDGWLDVIYLRGRDFDSSPWGDEPLVYYNRGKEPYFSEEPIEPDEVVWEEIGTVPINSSGGFVGDLNFDGFLDIYVNSHIGGSASYVLWGPYYNDTVSLPINQDHHAVFREPGNIYDRTYSAWYYSSIFDCGSYYDGAKNARLTYVGYEPSFSYIHFSLRSGPDSIPDERWTDWYNVKNGYGNPRSLRWRYVQYRTEFHYMRPCYLPWLEQVHIKFYHIHFDLRLEPDSVKTTSAGSYVDYILNLFYLGDERDSLHISLRPCFNPEWHIELWDTAYIDTIPWYFKLGANQTQGADTAFYARIYAPEDAQIGDSNITILYTKTWECSEEMRDSVTLLTYVVAPGVYESRIQRPVTLDVSCLGDVGWAEFALPRGEAALLAVYDAAGRLVYTRKVQGSGRVEWSDATTSSGLYFVRLERATETISRKIVLMR